jgi:adenine deaminase
MKSLFENARVIDGKGEVFSGSVAVDGKTIVRVSRGQLADNHDGFERIDIGGMTLLRGEAIVRKNMKHAIRTAHWLAS